MVLFKFRKQQLLQTNGSFVTRQDLHRKELKLTGTRKRTNVCETTTLQKQEKRIKRWSKMYYGQAMPFLYSQISWNSWHFVETTISQM